MPVMVRRLIPSERGSALVEFALVVPVFLLLLFGMIGYGAFFWRAHGFQQVANDAARAALGGLTAGERAGLARSAVAGELAGLSGVNPARVTTGIVEGGDSLTVTLHYDAAGDALLRMPFAPMPSAAIRRSATVRLAGL